MTDDQTGERGHPQNFTQVRYYAAEGARIGVVTCLRCGTSVSIDPSDRFDVATLHDEWHDRIEAALSGRSEQP